MGLAGSNSTHFIHLALAAMLVLSILSFTPFTDATAADRVTTFDTFNTEEPYVALTFDVTFDRGDGEQILNTLAAYGVKATFAVTGIWAKQNPDLMQRIVNEGHGLMNHTFDHLSMSGNYTGSVIHEKTDPLSHEEVVAQLQRTHDLVLQQTGVDMKPYVRPPYGDYTDQTLAAMADAGYTYNIMWTVDTDGWHARPVNEVVQKTLDAAQPGANILMHVGHGSTDGAALPRMIEELRARGFQFATVQEFVEGRLADPNAPHLAPDPERTKHRITQYWREHGGLLAFGYPLSNLYKENDTFVQYFQRARLELRRGAQPGEFEVHQSDLGAGELRDRSHGEQFTSMTRRDTGRCTVFENSNYRICGRLRYRWEDTGGPVYDETLTAETSN